MRQKQSGIFLVSAAIAVAVVGTLITFWGVQQGRQMRMERAERIGESLKVIGNAVETFTVKHHGDIDKALNGGDDFIVNGVTFTRLDTSTQLATGRLGNMNAKSLIQALKLPGVSDKPPPGVGDYAIQVERICDLPDVCRIETLTYLTEPIKQTYSSAPDFNLAGIAARKIGTYGGISTPDNPTQFRFLDQAEGVVPIANPKGQHAGLIAMRGGSQTKDLNNVLMRDGSRGMTGDLKLENVDASGSPVRYNISGARDINGKGKLTMGSLDVGGEALVKGTLNLAGMPDSQKTHNDIVNAGDIKGNGTLSMGALNVGNASVGSLNARGASTIAGTLSLENNDIDKANAVRARSVKAAKIDADEVLGNLKSKDGVVELNDAVIEGSECTVWGIGRDDSGRVMSCQPGKRHQWEWKLSGTAQSKEQVSPEVVREIVADARRDSRLWISVFTLDGKVDRTLFRSDRKEDYLPKGGQWQDGLYYKVNFSNHAGIAACKLKSNMRLQTGPHWRKAAGVTATLTSTNLGSITTGTKFLVRGKGLQFHRLLCLSQSSGATLSLHKDGLRRYHGYRFTSSVGSVSPDETYSSDTYAFIKLLADEFASE